MRRSYQCGFTLVELMVTLAVLTILAMVAAPSFATLIEKSRLRGAADDVVSLLGVARTEAVKRQRNVTVALGGSSSAWCVGANRAPDPTVVGQPTPGSSACVCTTASNCLLENQKSVVDSGAYSGVTISSNSGNVTFNAQLGTLTPISPAPNPVTLTSSTGKYAVKISVSPLGQVFACVPSDKVFMYGYQTCP